MCRPLDLPRPSAGEGRSERGVDIEGKAAIKWNGQATKRVFEYAAFVLREDGCPPEDPVENKKKTHTTPPSDLPTSHYPGTRTCPPTMSCNNKTRIYCQCWHRFSRAGMVNARWNMEGEKERKKSPRGHGRRNHPAADRDEASRRAIHAAAQRRCKM
jgi:hypothetical protein